MVNTACNIACCSSPSISERLIETVYHCKIYPKTILFMAGEKKKGLLYPYVNAFSFFEAFVLLRLLLIFPRNLIG